MSLFHHADALHCSQKKQRGGVLMVMLVIIIIGAATILVSALGSSAAHIDRDRTTANALAQAKEALIGRAASDSNVPGSLPCPDTNDDGSAELLSGNDCPSYIGRLPWRTLGLPDLRDGSGERLWYALSRNFRDDNSNHINSDSQGTLTVSGAITASNVIAIVFAPGHALSGQSRSTTATIACTSTGSTVTHSLCASNYLEGSNANSSSPASPNLNYQSATASGTFNDQMLLLTHEPLFHPVQMRIAREVKTCLDSYAQNFFNTYGLNNYPWAAPVSDTTNYSSTLNTYFGRIPTSESGVQLLIDDLYILQGVVANYVINYNSASARQLVIDTATKLYNDTIMVNGQTPLPPDVYNQLAKKVAPDARTPPALGSTQNTVNNWANSGGNSIQSEITNALGLHIEKYFSLQHGINYGCGCAILGGAYWPDWKNLVFYQVASGNQPGGSGCTTSTCLKINGTGSYRAAVIQAGQIISTDNSPRLATDASTYLEGINRKSSSDVPPTQTLETYRLPETAYSSNNDLAQCVDGLNNCK
jgi:type II secretory pathway pseudopilin PulG